MCLETELNPVSEIRTSPDCGHSLSNLFKIFSKIFRLRVVATDAGSPPMSSECEVAVTVVGGNEFSPKFQKSDDSANFERRVAVPAGLGPDTSVYELSATDDDSKILRFGTSGGNGSSHFRIDTMTGRITTTQSLSNLLPASTLVLEVTVSDGGIPNRTDATQVLFLVTADNLHAPEFQSPATRIYIREDEQVSGYPSLRHHLFRVYTLGKELTTNRPKKEGFGAKII